MYKTIELNPNRAEWLKQRQRGIGGSDVAAILGLSKWRSPLDVYIDKTAEQLEDIDNASMEWGRRLEPVIRQKYADETGTAVELPSVMFQSEEHPFMIADVDGIRQDGVIVEIKTARSGADWGEAGTEEIPEYYMTQVQHYMAVIGADRCDVAVLIAGSDFRIYPIARNQKVIEMLIEEERNFWEKVENRTPPEPRSLAEITRAFPTSKNAQVEATGNVMELVETLTETQSQIDKLKEIAESTKAKVMSFMGEADTLTFDDVTVATWKSSKPRTTLDSTALKKAMPDVYKSFSKTGKASRRFILKTI